MTPPSLVDVNYRPVLLDRQLASGGEGAVFTLPNDPTLVAKVYHRPPTTQTVEKLTTMVHLAKPQLLALAAWPVGLLYHARTRQLAGFVMPRLTDCQPIQHLYNPVQRLRSFPRSAWNFQVRAAVNLAAAFDEVHKAGCLVGDVNQSNVQVSTQALVRLIDCDSFQVRMNGKAYLCEVGVAHYIPPELQGKSLRGLVRSENHDRFGLAVLIYQLLFVGRHPYAGVYRGAGDPSFEQLIADFRFAQGPAAHTWGMAPPPHTPTFADIPPELGKLFRLAFERGSEAGNRPQPAKWLAALKSLESSIMECTVDPGHLYWRGAPSCVWCRLADHGGPEYYFGVAGGVGTFAVDEAKLQDALRRLAAIQDVDFPYDPARYKPTTPDHAKPIPGHIYQLWNVYDGKRRQLAREQHEQGLQAKRQAESTNLQLEQLRGRLERRHAQRQQELDAELRTVQDAAAAERSGRRLVSGVLLAATILGLAIALFSCYSWAFGVLGGLVALVFFTWLAIYQHVASHSSDEQHVATIRRAMRQTTAETNQRWRSAREQACQERESASRARKETILQLEEAMRQAAMAYQAAVCKELAERRQVASSASQSLAAIEAEWRKLTEVCRDERHRIEPTIRQLVGQCRSLSSQYLAELQVLIARSEVAARLRHMRLHLLADAEIPRIGAGRKEALASNGIFTAADIDVYRIHNIKGFGDILTSILLTWKQEVLQQFQFDSTMAVSPTEQRAISVKFQNAQEQILAELSRQVSHLESLVPACRASLEKLVPELQRAVAQYEQADASLRLLNGHG